MNIFLCRLLKRASSANEVNKLKNQGITKERPSTGKNFANHPKVELCHIFVFYLNLTFKLPSIIFMSHFQNLLNTFLTGTLQRIWQLKISQMSVTVVFV